MSVVLYRDPQGFYRWRIVTESGSTTAKSCVGFNQKRDAVDNLVTVANVVGGWLEHLHMEAFERALDELDEEIVCDA